MVVLAAPGARRPEPWQSAGRASTGALVRSRHGAGGANARRRRQPRHAGDRGGVERLGRGLAHAEPRPQPPLARLARPVRGGSRLHPRRDPDPLPAPRKWPMPFRRGSSWEMEDRFDVRTILREGDNSPGTARSRVLRSNLRGDAGGRTHHLPGFAPRRRNPHLWVPRPARPQRRPSPNCFRTTSPAEAAKQSAPDLNIGSRHYCVVDIKFSKLRLLTGGELGNAKMGTR